MKRYISVILLLMFLPGCAFFLKYEMFQKKSTYFTEDEKELLGKALEAVGYGWGFDPEEKLEYVYPYTDDSLSLQGKDAVLRGVLSSADESLRVSLYEKIYVLKHEMEIRLQEYEAKEKWKEHTYLKKYLYPPMQQFYDSYETAIRALSADYAAKIEARQKTLDTLRR